MTRVVVVAAVALLAAGCSQDRRDLEQIQACLDRAGDPTYTESLWTGNVTYLWCRP